MTFFKALEELNKTILKKFPDNCMEYNSDDEKQLKFVMSNFIHCSIFTMEKIC